ncbi:MAG: hypothetical protein IPL65_02210 [Lewinellaceae bacterium]|nr:hypothetical protein [Lewinellaceae bacterium]
MRNWFFLSLFAILIVSCSPYAKLLSSEQSMLSRVARSSYTPDQKIDSLFSSAIRVMDAALKPINPVKGGKMVAKYYDQNEAAMELIARDIGRDFDKMNLIDRGVFIVNVGRSGNARKFATLYPKFKKKYKQVKTAGKFLGFFAKTLGKLGKLADLIG